MLYNSHMDSAEFRTTFHKLDKPATVTRFGKPIGTWIPAGSVSRMADEEVGPMEEPVKKAIEPEQVKREPRGKLSKGLGEIPGVTRDVDPSMADAWTRSQPDPKPGNKK
jgi:hypothetical protein